MEFSVLKAARIDLEDPNPILPLSFVLGRALSPRGFYALQQPPLCFNEYVAARTVHAAVSSLRRCEKPTRELAKALTDYARLNDTAALPCAEGLRRLLLRAGVVDEHEIEGAVLLLLWTSSAHIQEACDLVAPRPVYPFLAKAIAEEVERARKKFDY
jgi:hypothetical protein